MIITFHSENRMGGKASFGVHCVGHPLIWAERDDDGISEEARAGLRPLGALLKSNHGGLFAGLPHCW